jgi:glucokinase
MARCANREPQNYEPKDITEHAINKTDDDCVKAFTLFCTLMGRFGGNLALNIGAFGGVYIAGGIAPRFVEYFKDSKFRAAFEDKGRFNKYLSNIPVYIVTHNSVGLLGSGVYLRQKLGKKI